MRVLDKVAILAGLAIALTTVAPAYGQGMPRPVERYNRVTKGANVTEWHRRLSDPDPKVRLEAVDSLTGAGGEEAVKPLLDAIADEDRRVKLKAIDGLGRVGLPSATTSLVQLLFLSQVEVEVHRRVLAALGRIRDASSASQIADFAVQVTDTQLRCAAIHAIGEIGAPASISRLEDLAKDDNDPDVHRLATDAISKINARLAALPDQQPSVIELERRLGPRQH